MKTRDLLLSVCACHVRYSQLKDGTWFIWPPDDETARTVCRAILDSGMVRHGDSGWFRLRQLGLVSFHFQLRLRRTCIRIIQPAIHPNDQFSNLDTMPEAP